MKNEFDYLNDVKMDFSLYEKENVFMKRNKKIIILAACLAVLTLTTAFASGFVGNIIKSISTGFNSFHQVDPDVPVQLMDELKGKIFDKDGNALDAVCRADIDNIFDKDGNKITQGKFAKMVEEATGGLVVYSSNDYNAEKSQKHFITIDEAQQTAVFDIKSPDWMPEGYSLSKIYTYKDENGEASGEYMTLVYKNSDGKEITMMERILNEDTAFEAGTDGTIEEITVNGNKGVIMNGTSLNFETADNVSVGIYSHGNVSKDELIKIAESIK